MPSVFDPPEDNPVQKFSRSVVPKGKKVKDQVFAFDRIFDDNAEQREVYEGTTKGLLDNVLDGYNATVFAYGATGCGKTHTITGTAQQPGIIFLTMQELFEKIGERSGEKVTEVTMSYLEIYNETIRDLLVPGGSKQGLMLREDVNQAVTVSGLTSYHPKDVQEVMDMIVRGNEYRTVSPTEANATSSRSHAVLQINVAQRDRNAGPSEPHTMATLSMIDLAGSERASATKNRGERLLEGANINKSLLALGSCINALCDPRRRNHIPYRNSKLTRLLKFSLGGNCKTVMIVCVSPSSAHFDETQNTLRYANRAKNIQTKVTRNVFNVNRHVKDFLVKIDEQMALINELKAQQKEAEAASFAKFRKAEEKRDGVCREGVQRLRAAYEHAAPQRAEKIANLKRLKAFERRISVLTAWLAAFDAVCEARGGDDDDDMPRGLVAIRRTAQGILAELEASRHHMHARLEGSNWERAVDTALHHGIKLLEGEGGEAEATAAGPQVATLQREAELLKAGFGREMYREVLEGERGADAATMQVLLTAQFEMVASMADTLAMSEEDAVAHAKRIVHRLLETGVAAASHVVRPDAAPPAVDPAAFPPSRRGTPKKRRSMGQQHHNNNNIPAPQQPVFAASAVPAHVQLSPVKGSPRRRKAPIAQRKVVNLTPKKKSPSKRSVRWRDDDGDGALVEFQKTPKKWDSSPEGASPGMAISRPSAAVAAPVMMADRRPASPSPLGREVVREDAGSPGSPEASVLLPGKPNRFQAGFLSKTRRTSNSPVLRAPSLTLQLGSSDTEEQPARPSPLRSLDVSRSSNMSPPPTFIPRASPRASPRPDENKPPETNANASATTTHSSDSEGSGSGGGELDARKIRNAMVKRGGPRRVSLAAPLPRASLGSSNGVGRRRNSGERRLSPPMGVSPPEAKGKAFSAGQARRMNMGGAREGSPTERDGSRRVTIGGVGASRRPSLAWR